MRHNRMVPLILGLSVASTVAFAQGTGGKPGSEVRAPSSLQDAPGDSLSKKLDKSSGVITPKGDVDPGIRVPAPVPNPDSTTIVPPAVTGGQSAK